MHEHRVRAIRGMERSGAEPAVHVLPDEPPEILDAGGRVKVGAALRHFRGDRGGPVVLVTGRDLAHPLFRSLLGYSDRRRRVAIVSTWRLGSDRLETRLFNLIAHESGHLRGLRHCGTPGCVMHPTRTPEELDSRGVRSCGRCPSVSPIPALICCAALLLLLFSVVDRVASWASPAHQPPFSWRSSAASTTLLFDGRPVIRVRGRRAEAELRVGADQLNAAFRQLTPQAPVAVQLGPDRAGIDWRGVRLIEFSKAQVGGAGAFESAQRWAGQLDLLLRGKGTRGEVCPTCHIDRAGEVQESFRRARRR